MVQIMFEKMPTVIRPIYDINEIESGLTEERKLTNFLNLSYQNQHMTVVFKCLKVRSIFVIAVLWYILLLFIYLYIHE